MPLGEAMNVILNKSGRYTPKRRAEIERAQERIAAQERALRVLHLRESCGTMPRDAAADLDDLDYPRKRLSDTDLAAYVCVRDQLRQLLDFPGTVVLCGRNGPGKTHLASALVHAFCAKGRAAFYCTALHFYRMLASTFDAPGRTQLDLYNRLSGALARDGYELLVIDEVEVQPGKPWHVNELRDLINARYGRMVATVLITNLGIDEINGRGEVADYFNSAVRSRIGHVGTILPCEWPSLRQPQWPSGGAAA